MLYVPRIPRNKRLTPGILDSAGRTRQLKKLSGPCDSESASIAAKACRLTSATFTCFSCCSPPEPLRLSRPILCFTSIVWPFGLGLLVTFR